MRILSFNTIAIFNIYLTRKTQSLKIILIFNKLYKFPLWDGVAL